MIILKIKDKIHLDFVFYSGIYIDIGNEYQLIEVGGFHFQKHQESTIVKRGGKMSKILLTGASGYIGGHLKDKLKINMKSSRFLEIRVTNRMRRMLLGNLQIYLI